MFSSLDKSTIIVIQTPVEEVIKGICFDLSLVATTTASYLFSHWNVAVRPLTSLKFWKAVVFAEAFYVCGQHEQLMQMRKALEKVQSA